MPELPQGPTPNSSLDPAMLHAGFTSYAAEIESPHDRAAAYALFVPDVEGPYPEVADECMRAAMLALREAESIPPERLDLEKIAYFGQNLLYLVAGATLDEATIAQLNQPKRNQMLVNLAIKRDDASLVPDDVESWDLYKKKLAWRDLNTTLAREISDPLQRALTLAHIVHRLDRRNTEGFDIDPASLLALEAEAWEALRAAPVDDRRFLSELVDFAAKRGPSFIVQIENRGIRLTALRDYGLAAQELGDAEGLEWSKGQYVTEMMTCENEIDTELVVKSLATFVIKVGDPALSMLIPDNEKFARQRDVTWHAAAISRAVKDKDTQALLELPSSDGRDWALKRIAVETDNIDLTKYMVNPNMRLETLSEIAGLYQRQELKQALVEDLVRNINLDMDDFDRTCLAVVIANLQDEQLARPFFDRNLLPPPYLKQIALRLKSVELAHSIQHDDSRSAALIGLAKVLQLTPLIEVSNATALDKADAYHFLFCQVMTEKG